MTTDDLLAAIEVVGAGKRVEVARLSLRAKMAFAAPFGYVEPNIWNASLSPTGIAINCQTSLLSKDLIDSIWTIELYLNQENMPERLSLVSQLVRLSSSGWVAFQFVRLTDDELSIIESLIEGYSVESSVDDPLDLTLS